MLIWMLQTIEKEMYLSVSQNAFCFILKYCKPDAVKLA